jgi:hypothetical protein
MYMDTTFNKNERFTQHLFTGKDEETNTHEDRTSLDDSQPVVAVMITINFVKNVFYMFCLC